MDYQLTLPLSHHKKISSEAESKKLLSKLSFQKQIILFLTEESLEGHPILASCSNKKDPQARETVAQAVCF